MLLTYDKTKGQQQGFLKGFGLGGVGFGDLNANKKLLTQGNNQKYFDALERAKDDPRLGINFDKAAEDYAKSLGNVDDKVVQAAKDIYKLNGTTANMSKTFENQTSITAKLGNSIKNLGGQFVSTLVNGAVSMIASAVLMKTVQYIQDIVNSYENLAKEVETISSKYTEQKNQLNEYSDEIIKLRGVMSDSSSTTQEVKDATSQLYDIQNSLIQQYGAYHDNINIVNGDLEEQLSLLQGINKENSQRSLDEINSIRSARSSGINTGANIGKQYLASTFGIGGGLVSLFKQSDAYFEKLDSGDNFWQAFIHMLTEQDAFNGEDIGEAIMGTSADQIKRMFEEYESTFKVGNTKVRSLMAAYGDVFKFNGDEVTVTGSVQKINDAVTNLRIQMNELGITDDAVFSDLNKVAIETQKRITTYGGSYNTIIENEILNNKDLSQSYSELTDKYNKYIAAQNKGDTEKVKQLGEEYVDLYAKLAESNIDNKYLEYFKNLYPELQTLISNWEFEASLKLNLESDKTVLDDTLQELNNQGLGEYANQIQSGALHKFGNVDMDKRAIIEWSEELKETYEEALESWDVDPEIGSISTALGGSAGFEWGGKEHEIAFTPILQTEDGAVLLTADDVSGYIGSVIDRAAEDGNITADEILKIDAEGTGWRVGDNFVKGLIAGIDSESGIAARTIGELLHYAGNYGAYSMARQQVSAHEDLASDFKRNSADEILARYNYYEASKDSGLISPELQAKYDLLTQLAAKAGMTVDQYVVALKSTREYSDSMQHLHDLMGENWDEEFANKLSDSNLEALVDIKPKEDGLAYTKEEIEEYLSPLQIEVEPNIEDSSAVKSLNDLESNWAGLDTVYQSTVNTPGTADAKDIESVNSAMGGVSKAGDEDINVLTNALEAYNTALVENKGNAQAAQEAVDKLATAYVDQSDILENLDEDNKDYYIDMLKNNGVTNAEEVVLSRLTKQAKETSKALKSLSKSLVDNYDILKQGKSAEGYNTALEDVQSKVKGLLQVYNEDGSVNMDLTPEINESFVTENLEDIKAATEGDVEALQRLRAEVARLNASKAFVGIDLPYDVIQGELNHIMDMVAQADAMDIEVGSYIDDSQFLAALAEMMSGSSETANAVAAAFESMGYTVEWAPKKATAIVPDMTSVAGASGVAGGNPANAAMRTSALEMNVPELRIKRSSSNSGSKVSFGGAPSGGSSGGGSGGGGGDNSSKSKVNKDTKETFDWIEVKLKRLQEAINRLNKTVTNTFESWTNRNKALGEEIAKVTEQIKAQEHAAKRYAKNAKNLTNAKVNVKPKASDYTDGKKDKQYKYDLKQWKEAEKLWKNGRKSDGKKYQDLIKEGLLGKNDIEQIKNKYLVNLINEFTEEYQKSVDAADAAEDARINKLELEAQKLDNVIEEWEEIIKLTEQSVEILDEYVDRTESLGFFINTNDMKKQAELIKKQRDLTKAELDKAIVQFNDLVRRGILIEGTQAYSEAQEKVFDIFKQYEEQNTKYMEQEKKIREDTWQKFDYLQERLDAIVKESEYVQKVLQSEKMMDDAGNLNNRGYANMAMIGVQFDEALRKMADYKKEIEDFKEVMDWNNKDDVKHLEELTEGFQGATDSMLAAKDSAKSFFEEIINAHLSKLKELMDEYKQTLSAAKDLYDFQKNISNQTKNIENLRKQLTAYQGDDSEAARKRRQELTNQLTQAEQQLQETEWDRYINQTGEMLDDLYEDYEENLNARLDNIDGLMQELIREVNANKVPVKNGLVEVRDKYGLVYDSLDKFIKDQSSNLLTGLENGTLGEGITTISNVVSDIEDTVKKMFDNFETTRKVLTDSFDYIINKDGTVTIRFKDDARATNEEIAKAAGISVSAYEDAQKKVAEERGTKLINATTIDSTPNTPNGIFADSAEIEKQKKEAEEAEKKKEAANVRKRISEINARLAVLKTKKDIPSQNEIKTLQAELGSLQNKLNTTLKGYATGISRVPSNQLAWTQEKGSELIFRRSDGAMLTPLGSGDMVFTNSMSRTLWELAKEYEHLKIATGSVPDIKSNVATTINQNNQIEITLPNVNDYASFKYELQNDIKFEKFIQEITLGQAMGNNTLNKRKY